MEESVKKISTRTSLANIIAFAFEKGVPFAIWRKPEHHAIQGIIQQDPVLSYVPNELESLPAGFLMAPFQVSFDEGIPFIRADQYFESTGGSEIMMTGDDNGLDELHRELETNESKIRRNPPYYNNRSSAHDQLDHKDFIRLVNRGLDEIKAGNLHKIVPSRFKQVPIPHLAQPVDIFNRLTARYPNAFVSMAGSQESGLWIGASPELLIETIDDRWFKTVSLAGTQPLPEEVSLGDISWKQKDIEEQAMVSRYIINCFKTIRLREFEEIGPRTVAAGNLAHLKTTYKVDMEKTSFPLLGSVMMRLLHPTSAVSGMPKDAAAAFLRAQEPYDRKFYSGFLGPVNLQQQTNIYVNLRCMEWHGDSATLYAGAGITEYSDPETEWAETGWKLNTLGYVLSAL